MTLTENGRVITMTVTGTMLTATVVVTATLMVFAMFLARLLVALLIGPILFAILIWEILHIITLKECQGYELAALLKILTLFMTSVWEILHIIILRRFPQRYLVSAKQTTTKINLTMDLAGFLIEQVERDQPKTERASINLILLPTLPSMKGKRTILTNIKTAVTILNHNEANTDHIEPLVLRSKATLPGPHKLK